MHIPTTDIPEIRRLQRGRVPGTATNLVARETVLHGVSYTLKLLERSWS
jgi:hypothetical protein